MNRHAVVWTKSVLVTAVVCTIELCSAATAGSAPDAIDIGSRRELWVDSALIERIEGHAGLRLHHPTPRELAITTEEPWEGNGTNYVTVFQDGDRYRMYYRGGHYSYEPGHGRSTHRDVYCYAESPDGVVWTKPELGLFTWDGSKKNNIVWDGVGAHAFVPFKDANPNCSAEAKYKALGVGGKKHGLYAFASSDGIHWSLIYPEPVITKGAFDSQNLAFWDTQRHEYREYHRDFRNGRDIRTSTSKDFVHWTEPEWLSYRVVVNPGRAEKAAQPLPLDVIEPPASTYPAGRIGELYTNQIVPYFRAPQLLLGFPTRYIDHGWIEAAKGWPRLEYRQVRGKNSRREGTAVTDGMFIAGRDRQQFSVWPESFIRPGLRTHDTWFYGDIYQAWGLVETKSAIEDAPPELSMYVTERIGQEKGARLRRYTLRLDGFVSLEAPLAGGELITKPLIFQGNKLTLNFSTSAAGTIRVELQSPNGQPVPGFALNDCDLLLGDSLDQTVSWKRQTDVSRLTGQPVRLRFAIQDADVYSLQFRGSAAK
jgi:hypothetical protein